MGSNAKLEIRQLGVAVGREVYVYCYSDVTETEHNLLWRWITQVREPVACGVMAFLRRFLYLGE